MSDLSVYARQKKSPGPKRKAADKVSRQVRKKRLSIDGHIKSDGTTRLTVEELLELLHQAGDDDLRWIIRQIQANGASTIREKIYTGLDQYESVPIRFWWYICSNLDSIRPNRLIF